LSDEAEALRRQASDAQRAADHERHTRQLQERVIAVYKDALEGIVSQNQPALAWITGQLAERENEILNTGTGASKVSNGFGRFNVGVQSEETGDYLTSEFTELMKH
jgi:hypothetical protein